MTLAVDIVREYLATGDDSQKRNAIIALQTIATPEALDSLTAVALEAADDSHRSAAIAALKQAGTRDAIDTLVGVALDPADEQQGWARTQLYDLDETRLGWAVERAAAARDERPGDVYKLLADVQRHAANAATVDVGFAGYGPGARLVYTWSNAPEPFARSGGWYKALLPSAIGGVAGTILWILYLAFREIRLSDDSTSLLFFWGLIAVPLLAIGPAAKAAPIANYPERLLGAVVESMKGVLWVLPAAFLAGAAGLLFAAGSSAILAYLLIIALGSLVVPIVRLGSICQTGLPARWGVFVQALVGASYGFLYVALLAAVFTGYASAPDSFAAVLRRYALVALPLLVPLCTGLAAVYAMVDSLSKRQPPADVLPLERFAGFAPLVVVASLLFVFSAVEGAGAGRPILQSSKDQTDSEEYDIAGIPFEVDVVIESPQTLDAHVAVNSGADYVMQVVKLSNASVVLVSVDDPETIDDFRVTRGVYRITVDYYSGFGEGVIPVGLGEILPRMLPEAVPDITGDVLYVSLLPAK